MNQPYNPLDPHWMYENTNGVVKVSYWSMSMYERCPAQYHYSGQGIPILGVEDKRNAVVGSIEHSVIEDMFREKNYEEPELGAKAEASLERFLMREHVTWRSDQDKKQVLEEIKDDLNKALPVLREEGLLVPHAKPEITVSGYLTNRILLKGRIDLYLDDPQDAAVIDNKAVENENNLDVHQLTFYKLLLRRAGRNVPKRLGWFLTKFGRVKWRNITEEDEKKLAARIEDVAIGIRNKKFPYKTSAYHCQWCNYNDVCPAFKNRFPHQELLGEVKQIQTSGTVKF